MQAQLQPFHWVPLVAGLLAASIWDIRARRVPNWLTVGLLAAGLTVRWLGAGPAAAGWGVAGAALGLAILIFPFARGWLGAGDVKLLAAAGGWLGPLSIVSGALLSAVAGGVVAVVFLVRSPPEVKKDIVQNLKTAYLARSIPDADARPARHSPPYAVAIAAGTLATLILEAYGLAIVR